MTASGEPEPARRRWTRRRAVRVAAVGAAAIGGGAALGRAAGSGATVEAAVSRADAAILDVALTLERVHQALYREAARASGLGAELRKVATELEPQEGEHVQFLVQRLGNRAGREPRTDFGRALESDERFLDAAIELEEAAIAVYVGQAANLSPELVGPIGTLVSVEARQAAWLRDLARISPAPRAADPARDPDRVLRELRRKGYLG